MKEGSSLLPWPPYEYAIVIYKEATVPASCHVYADGVHYRVPFLDSVHKDDRVNPLKRPGLMNILSDLQKFAETANLFSAYAIHAL